MPPLKEMITAEIRNLEAEKPVLLADRANFNQQITEAGLCVLWEGNGAWITDGAGLVCTVTHPHPDLWFHHGDNYGTLPMLAQIAREVAEMQTAGTPNPPSPPQRKQEVP